MVAAQGSGGLLVLEDGQLIVGETVPFPFTGSEVKGLNFFGFAEDVHGGIENMTGQFEKTAPRERRKFLPHTFARLLAHHGVDLHDFPEPALADRLEHKFKCGIIAEHVAHLDGQPLPLGRFKQFLEGGEGWTCRFIQMNMLASLDHRKGRGDQVLHSGFDYNRLESSSRVHELIEGKECYPLGPLCVATSRVPQPRLDR